MTGQQDRRATVATWLVLAAALAGVAAVWLLSAWWSFAEQTRAAGAFGFEHPPVLPWTLDGLAFSLALVALAAALDGRSAPLARLGVLLALTGSVWANRLGVQIRTNDAAPEDAVRLAAVAPLSAFVAFEVILSAVRRLVMRWRGLPAPAPIPALRPVRLFLAPGKAWSEWRTAVLARTDPALIVGGPGVDPARAAHPSAPPTPETAAPSGRAVPTGPSDRPSTPQSPDGPVSPRPDRPGTTRRPVRRPSNWTTRRRPLPRSVHPSTRPPSGVQLDSRQDRTVDVHPPGGVDTGQDRTPPASTPRPRRGGQDRTAGRSPKAARVDAIMSELGVVRSRAYTLAGDPAALARARAARGSANGHAPAGTP